MADSTAPLRTGQTPKRSPEACEDEEYPENVQPTAEASTAKRPRLQKGLSYSNILISSERSTRACVDAMGSDGSSPKNVCHSTRGSRRVRAAVNYDMHFHPADVVLRPNHAATKAAREKTREAENTSDGDVSRNSHYDGADENQSPSAKSTKGSTKPDFAVVIPLHRTTRSGRNVKAANYNMKHHPMDDALRPKTAAKRSERFQELSPSSKPAIDQVVPAGDGLQVDTSEDALIETLRSDLLDSNHSFMDANEVEELWSEQESQQKGSARNVSTDECKIHNDVNIDIEQNTNIGSSTSSELNELQFSPHTPAGARRAARRLLIEKKRLDKVDKYQQQAFSNPPAERRGKSIDTSPSPEDRRNLTNRAGKPEQPQDAFAILEDQAGMTPMIREQIAAHRISPDTDTLKENLEPEHSESAETPSRPHRHAELSTTPPSRSNSGPQITSTDHGGNHVTAAYILNCPIVVQSHFAMHTRNYTPPVIRPYPANPHVTVRRYRPTAADFM